MSHRVQVSVGGQWTDWFAVWIPERETEGVRAKGEPVAYALSAPGTAGYWCWENGDQERANENPILLRFGGQEPRPYEISRNNGLKWMSNLLSLDELNEYIDLLTRQGIADPPTSGGGGTPWGALAIAAAAAWIFFGSTRKPRSKRAK